jgi:hypothetical protein
MRNSNQKKLPVNTLELPYQERKEKNSGVMKESQHDLKIVIWSEEDQCFVGQCPGIIGPCCHGDDEIQVYAELCQIVEE